jgi:tetratricopeptide (TPR) repeat protein
MTTKQRRKAEHRKQDTPDRPERTPLSKLFLLIPVLAFLVYLNTFGADFTYDDIGIIKENAQIRALSNVPDLFTTSYWGELDQSLNRSLYRPITVTTYALQYSVSGLNPRWYHIVNVLLHVLASVLLFFVVRELFRDRTIALVSGLLFAVHAVHTEAVAGIVGRAEILAFIGIMLCIWMYFRAMTAGGARAAGLLVISVLAYFMGMMSKEGGITAPIIILMTEIVVPRWRYVLRARHRAISAFAGYGFAAAIFLILRSQALSDRVVHLGFTGVTSIERIWTGLRVAMEDMGLLFAPVGLTADYWKVPISRSPSELAVLAAILMVVSILFVIAWSQRKSPAIAWGLCLWGITLFPVSNIAFAIGTMKAERLLYSPSAGLLAAVAGVAAWLVARGGLVRRLVIVVVIAAVAALSVLTWKRNFVWENNYVLAKDTLEKAPDSPSFTMVMGNWFRDQGNNAEARKYYLRLLEVIPFHRSALLNLGNIALDEGDLEEAISYYKRVLNLHPDYTKALNNLGQAYDKLGRYEEAADMYVRFMELKPDNPYPYVNLQVVYLHQGNLDAALEVTQEALRRFPSVADIHYNASAIYQALGREEDARDALEQAGRLQ